MVSTPDVKLIVNSPFRMDVPEPCPVAFDIRVLWSRKRGSGLAITEMCLCIVVVDVR